MLANIESELAPWEYADGATLVYAPAVLEEVRRVAVEGFTAFGHGGLEIGGVLYGTREGGRIAIQYSAELECEHALGPGFLLSENDRQLLAKMIQPPPGLETVGWYRSHTRKGLELDAADRELFAQFASMRVVGLVVKPSRWGPSAAAFYGREESGEILPPSPRELRIDPPRAPAASAPVATETVVTAVPAALPVIDPMPQPHRPRTGVRTMLTAAAGAAVPLAILATIYLWIHAPRKSDPLDLRVYAVAPGQLRIDWNQTSRAIAQAASGTLEIHDGAAVKRIALDSSQLRGSSITYTQSAGDISVKLHVDRSNGGGSMEESTQFIGPPAFPQTEAVALPAAPPAPAPEAALRLKKPVAADAPVPVAQPREKFEPSFPTTTKAAPATAILPVAPAPAPAGNAPALPDFLPRPQVLPRPAPPPVMRPDTAPRSGRLIWTGELARRGMVEIQGAHASIGSLSGSLAASSAEYRIWPAEFTRDGLTVYTTDGKLHGHTEPPSKSNGWNDVLFQFDPVRAGDLVVVEKPNLANHFSRLVLRNDARTCPVIVVEWTAEPPVDRQ